MTIDVYDGNNGIAMGLAEVGGGGVKADGALYQYMGSVATYQALLELDTTDFKPGYVYDVQEDGMDYAWTGTVWNALGTHTDLSGYYTKTETDTLLSGKANVTDLYNYYNKTQTDVLLNEKQDILTPNAPLTIASYIRSNAYGFTFSDSSHIYSTSGSFREYYAPLGEYAGNFISCNTSSTDMWANSTFSTTQENFKSYIDIPLSKDKMITVPSDMALFIGYYNEDGVFLPISQLVETFSYTDGSGYYFYLAPGSNFLRVPQNKLTTTNTTNQPQVTTYSKFYLKDAGSSLTLQWQSVYDAPSIIRTTNIESTSTLASRMTVARAVRRNDSAGYNPSNAIDVSTLGLYDYTGDFTNFDPSGLTNLFDITGEQVYNYLDLHIGNGLAVQNGNLVNTNPTAPSVMTGATSSTAGTSGLVPAPQAGDNEKFLSGDGTYKTASGPDMSNYYNKSETDALLETKIPTDSVTTPLEYSVTSHSVQSITITGTDNEYCYLTNSNSNSLTSSGDNTRIYTVKTNSEGILDDDYNIVANYDNLISNESPWIVFNYAQNYSRNSNQTRYTPTIGHIDANGVFTPYILCDMGLYGDRLFIGTSSTSTESTGYTTYTITGSNIYQENWNDPENYSGVMIKLEVSGLNVVFRCKIIQNDGTIVDSVWDNKTLGTLADLQNYGLNAVIFNTTSYFASNNSNLLKVAEIGIFSSTTLAPENQLWSVADTTYTKYLQLNIGAGLAVQGGNLVNTNPTPVDVSTKVTGDGISTIKALTQAEYDALATKDANTFYVIVPASNS